MDIPDRIQRAKDPKYIPGIYNYCDRWCERCLFTERCLNYDSSAERKMEQDGLTADNEEFWEEINNNFEETMELIQYVAEQKGIDLDNLEPDPDQEQKEEERRQDAENHPLAQTSFSYAQKVRTWLKEAAPTFEAKADELVKNQEMNIKEEASNETGLQIMDALEVIQWYNLQIHVKLMRALQQIEMFEDEDDDDFQSDADGSAKVALIGMDNSIGAWGTLQQYFPDKEDDILDFLVQLEQLRRNTETAFPKARSFVRPGFDTGHSPVYQG